MRPFSTSCVSACVYVCIHIETSVLPKSAFIACVHVRLPIVAQDTRKSIEVQKVIRQQHQQYTHTHAQH